MQHYLDSGGREETVVMRTRYLEDFTVGEKFRTAGVTFDEAGIVEFARQFDPQSIHIDAAAAATGPFEGLIASGFHTAASLFRTWVDLGFLEESSLGGPGIDPRPRFCWQFGVALRFGSVQT